VKNTALATDILRQSCERGQLIFDLEPKQFFETGSVIAKAIPCDGS